MIPSDVRLFTWLDVEEVISRATSEQAAPQWLVKASAYWNELTINISTGSGETARQWVRQLFDPRIANPNDDDVLAVVLEAVNGDERVLPVVFEEVDEPVHLRALPPTFSSAAASLAGAVTRRASVAYPETNPQSGPSCLRSP